MTDRTQKLIDFGKSINTLSLIEGTWNEDFQNEASNHAAYQARKQFQSHYGFSKRTKRLNDKYSDCKFAEICCEAWPGQSEDEAVKDAFTVSWPASKAHWKVVIKPCTFFGIAMFRGKNKIFYTCMLVGYCKDKPDEPDEQGYILW